VFTPAMVIVVPEGVPVCLKPVKQHSPGAEARVGEVIALYMGVEDAYFGVGFKVLSPPFGFLSPPIGFFGAFEGPPVPNFATTHLQILITVFNFLARMTFS